VLINNAGIMAREQDSSVLEVDEAVLRRTLETNFYGAFRLLRAVLPHMKERGYGRIVNVSSGLGQLDDMGSGWVSYRMSKTILNAMTRTASAELGSEVDVLINAVCPGWCRTDMGGDSATRSADEGAAGIVWAALLPADGPRGRFLRDQKEIPW
jgi:NAD(P)-dependent dehydrogenase (short-subunit alcohol dehydrogenase family)